MNIKDIKSWFETAIPNPTIEQACIQIGCHFEEVFEMQDCLDGYEEEHINDIASDMKKNPKSFCDEVKKINKIELLDSLCDQIVTAIGVAHMLGLDIEGALKEVNDSNHSKFEDGKPVFNEQGKISKGKHYKPPQLKSFI
jgi:predicted HAD superfamily Cof-like phosphohydrolase